jgi:acyl-CoA synthetase (NDP forming)
MDADTKVKIERIFHPWGLRFSKLVSSGNEANLTAVDFLEFLGQDPDTGIEDY